MIYDYVHNPAEYDVEPRWWLFVDLSGEPVRPLPELTLDDPEVWMPVHDYADLYDVSSHGRVRSKTHSRLIRRRQGDATYEFPGRVLRTRPSYGYPGVTLNDGRERRRSPKVHWLVAASFLGPRPPGALILHGDDNRYHNAPANLRYGTRRENGIDAFMNGRTARGRNPIGDDLPVPHASAIRALAGVILVGELARTFGRSPGVISMIGHRKIWKHAPDMALEEALQIFVEAKLLELERRRSAA